MTKVAIITMVQAADLPHALCSLASTEAARRDGDSHLALINDRPDPAVSAAVKACGAEIIEAGRNLGVAGGRNRLIREAIARGAEFVLSIDDDILIPPDFIDVIEADFHALRDDGANPGILTPATLDFHAVAPALFNEETVERIHRGEAVATPPSDALRLALAGREKKRARDIYHMGIADWRGAYLYAGGKQERRIQAAYDVEPEKLSGAESHLRHAKNAWPWIVEKGAPQPIDTAPGGICFYPVRLAEEVGFHDERFNPFGFEDADFALRAGRLGYQHYCAPRAISIHDIASRLSERPVAALRATQGKMAGAFARKHVSGRESAAALAAIARRTADLAVSREFSRREENRPLKTPTRLAGLIAFILNAALAATPARGQTPDTPLFDRLRALVLRAVPHVDQMRVTDEPSALRIESANGAGGIVLSRQHESADAPVTLTVTALSMPRDLAPELLAAASIAPQLSFDISAIFADAPSGEISVRDFRLQLVGAFEIAGEARFSRGEKSDLGIEPLRIDIDRLVLRDEGGAARMIRLLAEVDRLAPAIFIERAAGLAPATAQAFLRGEANKIGFAGSTLVTGEPGEIEWNGAVISLDEAIANPSMVALWRDAAETVAPTPPDAAAPEIDHPIRESRTMNTLLAKILRDDPSVAPFPEAYNPPKSLRVARRLRYLSASRGLPLTPNEAKLVSFRNRHRGERAFIIGNGPSLNLVDLTKLRNETTFGVNAIYLNQDKMGFLPTHHIVEDVFVAEDRADEINALRGPHKWYGHYLRYCLKPTPEVCWLNVACDYRNYPGFPNFSTNASRIVWVGGTVSYIALQLAYHMGFDEVYLVGFDHSYSIPKEAKVEGRAITSTSDDPNHFHPGYFGKGYRWHDPRVDRMERAYINARAAYDAAGRKVYNATVGGHLEVFERVAFDSLFA